VHVRLIGYWCIATDGSPGEDERWPDPRDLVDESWSNQERELVASYLEQGFKPWAFMGHSDCRLCGKMSGSAEFTDGTYLWPEGLAHYVREHSVKLPAEVLAHVRRRYDELGPLDANRDWSAEYPDPNFFPGDRVDYVRKNFPEQFADFEHEWDGMEPLFVDRDWWPKVTRA